MSGAFDDVSLEWQGQIYKIPAARMMGAIARIEDHVTLPELGRYGDRGTAPLSRLSAAFGSVLRYAGANVEDEDVYAALFAGGDQQASIAVAISTLLTMMVPRKVREKAVEIMKGVGDAGNLDAAAKPSSKKPSSSRSRKSGSRRRSSGTSRSKSSIG